MTKKDFEVVAKIVALYEQAYLRVNDANRGEKAYDNAIDGVETALKATNDNFDLDKFWDAVNAYQDELIDKGY